MMREKDQGSGLEVTPPHDPGDPGVTPEEYIGPGFRSRGLYGEVSGPEDDDRTRAERSPGRFAGCGPRGYRRPDARIAEDINEALTWHPDIDASEVEVHVAQGTVTLTGAVHDHHTRRLIVEVATGVVGVCQLDDRLSVGHGRAAGE